MAVINLLVKQYAVCIYAYGTRTFSSIPAEYHNPVMQYAINYYTLSQIDNAYAQGYITESEYQETLALPKTV